MVAPSHGCLRNATANARHSSGRRAAGLGPTRTAKRTRAGKTQEAGYQLDAFGRRSISMNIPWATEAVFNRCMETARRAGSVSMTASGAPRGVAFPPISRRKTAVSGHSLRLAHFGSVNPDCSSRGATQIRVIGAPANGRISTARVVDFAGDLAGQYAACNQARLPEQPPPTPAALGSAAKIPFACWSSTPQATRESSRIR